MLAAIFGLVFGSFLNVCITRLPQGESVQHPRSHCRQCPRTLSWWENIPVVSWIFLRGRCRGCHTPISWRYPLVEITLAALWVACFVRFGTTPPGARAGLLCFLLLGLAVTDFETLLLPDAMTIPGIIAGIVLAAAINPDRVRGLEVSLVGAATGAVILLAISGLYYLIRRKQGMGLGDVKLIALIGAFLGAAQVLFVFFVGTIATSIAALVWLAARRFTAPTKGSWLEHPMPYGTFLAASGIWALFYGQPVIHWYISLYR